MSDETFYRYTSNKDPWDTTASIVVAVDDDGQPSKVLHRGGDPVALTEDELVNARRRFNLSKATESQLEAAGKAEDGGGDEEAATSKSRRGRQAGPTAGESGGVVDPRKGSKATAGDAGAGSSVDDGQGSQGASGQDAGTTTGGTR